MPNGPDRGYNRAAAYEEFRSGGQLEDISLALAIPIHELKRWAREENWVALTRRSAGAVVPLNEDGATAERAKERIKANREKNLLIAQKLQEDLLEVIEKLRAGTLKVKKVFANGMAVDLDPGLRDRGDLALYAKNVAELSYRALGDVTESAKNPPSDPAASSAGQITIILPPAVASPRQKRLDTSYDVDSQVVTLEKPALVGLPEDTQTSSPPSTSPSPTDSCEDYPCHDDTGK